MISPWDLPPDEGALFLANQRFERDLSERFEEAERSDARVAEIQFLLAQEPRP